MARKLDDVMAALKDLRLAVEKTQADLAQTLGVGQDTVSRLEQRSDMLLSTLRRYVEAMGGKLELVAQFPNRPPVVIDHLTDGKAAARARHSFSFVIPTQAVAALE